MSPSRYTALDDSAKAGVPSPSLKTVVAEISPTEATSFDREALFEQFLPLMQRLIRQYGHTSEMRKDMLGELFCRFHTFLDRYDPNRGIPVAAYLVCQLMSGAYDYARSQRRRQQHEVVLFQKGVYDCRLAELDPTPLWDAALRKRQIAALLPSLLADLPPRQRQVVILRYFEDRSFEEIARMLDIKPSSARSLLRHGLLRLRTLLASNPAQR